uniref:Uncharacterized protein n=1 Tax=Timema cristinae TaxID=61476 RepID=A0A7R9DD69_TIMCR|nr:unnamed protein product [Timema cristinae]
MAMFAYGWTAQDDRGHHTGCEAVVIGGYPKRLDDNIQDVKQWLLKIIRHALHFAPFSPFESSNLEVRVGPTGLFSFYVVTNEYFVSGFVLFRSAGVTDLVSTKALQGAKSIGNFLFSAVNKAGKTVSEASAKIKKTVEENAIHSEFCKCSWIILLWRFVVMFIADNPFSWIILLWRFVVMFIADNPFSWFILRFVVMFIADNPASWLILRFVVMFIADNPFSWLILRFVVMFIADNPFSWLILRFVVMFIADNPASWLICRPEQS